MPYHNWHSPEYGNNSQPHDNHKLRLSPSHTSVQVQDMPEIDKFTGIYLKTYILQGYLPLLIYLAN